MAVKKVEIQDHNGNVYHPHTDAKVVFTSDGKSVEEELKNLKQSANNGKNIVATAIGTPLSSNDTFTQMGTKIDTLTKNFQDALKEIGVEVISSDKMLSLIGKVRSIEKCDIQDSEDTHFFTVINTSPGVFLCKNSFEFLGAEKMQKNNSMLSINGGFDGIKPRLFSIYGSSMTELDIDTFAVINTIDVKTLGFTCISIGFDDIKPRVFVGYGSKSGLSEIDLDTLTIIKQFPQDGLCYNKSINFIKNNNIPTLYTYNSNGHYIDEYSIDTYTKTKRTKISDSTSGFAIGSREGVLKSFAIQESYIFCEVDSITFSKIQTIPLSLKYASSAYITSVMSYAKTVKYKNEIYYKK